ncbi:MAG: Holliday junction resolvase RuvX [Clostridiales bacterium]
MRLLGLDVGTKTIGVAISDPLGWIAQGLDTVRRKNMALDLEFLMKIIQEKAVDAIVVGLPLHMDGNEGESSLRARELAEALAEKSGKKIIYRDERLSTVAAEKILLQGDVSRQKRKKVIDKMAAVYILQGYLDYLANHPEIEV